jgi:hypothetical protein
MILLIQDRKNTYHIADYINYVGNKYTICHKIYTKQDIITTLSLKRPVNNLCKTCCSYLEKDDLDILNNWVRTFYDKHQNNLIQRYVSSRYSNNTFHKYQDIANRFWRKLSRLKFIKHLPKS